MKETEIYSANLTVHLFAAESSGPLIFYHEVKAFDGEKLQQACLSAGCPPFSLAAVSGHDWNRDMTPWPAPSVIRGEGEFPGKACGHLKKLTEDILPEVLAELPAPPLWTGIAGYSLSGLFALYAGYESSAFERIACVSGSLWYPGFPEYAEHHKLSEKVKAVYLSIGNLESRTRHPVLKNAQPNMEKLAADLQKTGPETFFELNPGNHYFESAERTARGIRWLLLHNQKKES